MKKEIQINLLKEIIQLARKAMISSPLEQEQPEEQEEEECPACAGEGCDECMEEDHEPEFKNGNIKFVKIKVKRPKGIKGIVEKLMGG